MAGGIVAPVAPGAPGRLERLGLVTSEREAPRIAVARSRLEALGLNFHQAGARRLISSFSSVSISA